MAGSFSSASIAGRSAVVEDVLGILTPAIPLSRVAFFRFLGPVLHESAIPAAAVVGSAPLALSPFPVTGSVDVASRPR